MLRRFKPLRFDSLEQRRMMAGDSCHVLGDSNRDGVFDSSDLVQVFQGGRFETNQAAEFADGDWNGDGVFDTSDLVAAFQDDRFEQPFTSCQLGQIVYEGPSAHPFDNNHLSLEEDGTGTVIPGSDIAFFVESHVVHRQDDGSFALNLNVHTGDQFVYTMPTLYADTIFDPWGTPLQRRPN